MRRLLTLGTACFLAVCSSVAASRPDDKADQILRHMHERSRKIATVQASIVQVKHFGDIGTDQRNAGSLYFRHDAPNKDKIRITYRSGNRVKQDLLIDGDKIMLYQPEVNQVIITSRAKQAERNPEFDFLAAPYGSVSGLKSRYNTTYQGDENNSKLGPVGSAVIQLTPTGPSSYKSVTFWVDQSSWFPVQYQVTERNGDINTLTLSDIKKNGDVPAGAFKLDLPKNTKRIEQ
jgi:outer membrane lipoprotein-sorting protein